MDGTLIRLYTNKYCGNIRGDDDRIYFFYAGNLDRFTTDFYDLKIGMRVRFTPAESDRKRDDPRAVEVRVIRAETLDGL